MQRMDSVETLIIAVFCKYKTLSGNFFSCMTNIYSDEESQF